MMSIKRPEENYKFVFKRCLKHMKETLKSKNHEAKMLKKDFEKWFAKYYFQEVVDFLKIPIESFFHPKNSNQHSKSTVKTINSQYISNIVQSKKFVTDFMNFLNNGLEKQYNAVIKQKIAGLFDRWEKEYQHASNKEEVIRKICQNIEKNTKCKLPWTIIEVRAAIDSVNQLFRENMDFC